MSSGSFVSFLKSLSAFRATENLAFGKPRVVPPVNSFSIMSLYSDLAPVSNETPVRMN